MNKKKQTIGKKRLIQHLEHTTGFCKELWCQTICDVQQIVSISASILNHFWSQRTQSPIFTLGFQNQGREKQNESGYQAIATLEFLSFKQTEILNAKRNMPYNMYALGYHFHKHVMYSTPNIMLKSKQIHENILCKETSSLLNRRKIQRWWSWFIFSWI